MTETRIDVMSDNQFRLFARQKQLEDLVFIIGLGLVIVIPIFYISLVKSFASS